VVDRVYVAGDHTMVIGAVRAFDVLSDQPPLLFVQRRYAQLPDRA
jgi:flavin reductase (DIM6/NTAB) family NADH-FMN oxidoreductase RutF